ncbi:MAG TPA: cation:proton antiporter [Candidatus Dormibacteraeota bacterium]|jgi:CPA2 family monovalent cation:H+ antiporter-2|nr:cation:proton antiporter [Candidatus Dormibacteraeota bacterium]
MVLSAAAPETAPAILEIGLLLLLAVGAGWVARRFGLPAVLGYLVVGLIVSPFTPGYVADRRQLQVLADVGVVLLLFEVGIEIDPVRLVRNRTAVLWTAPVQVLVTTVVVAVASLALGIGWRGAILVGLSIALSSSVVVVNITRSRRRTTNRATEEALLSWSVMQDMIGVALALLVIGFLGLGSRPPIESAGLILAYVAIVIVAAWLLPRLLHALNAEHDLFLMLSVGSGLALAGVGARYFEVPLALAAFVSGLAIGESPAAAEARQRILPFRDLFAVLFFVLLGSLIDPSAVPRALPWIGFLLVAVVVAKALPAVGLSRLARLPDVRHWQLGIGLGQVGEFSFVLAGILLARDLIPTELFTAMLATVVLTIAASAVLVRVGKRTALNPAAAN